MNYNNDNKEWNKERKRIWETSKPCIVLKPLHTSPNERDERVADSLFQEIKKGGYRRC